MVKKQDLHPQVKLMIASSADRKGPSFGKGAATLLHGIEQNGSLNKTAKDLHMAYSKAWSMIKKVEEGLGFTLIWVTRPLLKRMRRGTWLQAYRRGQKVPRAVRPLR